jgi:nucleoside-diphosphate-sugar epimerase
MGKNINKVLVTGGAGFIGSHITDKLLQQDIEVTILDNFDTGKIENLEANKENKNLKIIRGDIRNTELIKNALNDIDAIFHEAAIASVNLSVQNPIASNDVNVTGTVNLLKAAVDSGAKRFIFASSAAVYGDSDSPIKTEDTPLNPRSPYGTTKLAGESYLKVFYMAYGLETVSLRYFNVYGPRQRFDTNSAYGGAITIFINRLIKNLPPIINGDGEQTRDFVYIEDIVNANMLALTAKNAIGQVFNVGTGQNVSVNKTAELIKKLLKKESIQNVYGPAKLTDIKHGYADINKAKKILDFQPKYPISSGLPNLIDWYLFSKITNNQNMEALK